MPSPVVGCSMLLALMLAGTMEDAAVAEAEVWLGTPWAWNGQGTAKNPGMGCMSLVFRAWSEASGVPRTRYPVNPSEMRSSGLLGPTVGHWGPGETTTLERGDVVFLLTTSEIPDDPMLTHEGVDYWPWHMGLYAGEGQLLHAEPGGVVRSQELSELAWERVLGLRPGAP